MGKSVSVATTEDKHFFGTSLRGCAFLSGSKIVGYYFKPYADAFGDLLDWLFADKRKRKILKYVPNYCQNCEVLGMCRDEKNNWNCINGCWFIQSEYEMKQKKSRDSVKLPVPKPYRLKNYDYSTPGNYFITLCTREHKNIFWENLDDYATSNFIPIFSKCGNIVYEAINNISENFFHCTVDEYVIMPNHIHLILHIHGDEYGKPLSSVTISEVIRNMKEYTLNQMGLNIWETGFYDYIIRYDLEYDIIWDYIEENYCKWTEDRFYNK